MLDDDTEETLHERIKEVERRLYPDVIERLVNEPRRNDEHEDQTRAAVGLGQDRPRRPRAGPARARASSSCRRATRRPRSRRPGIPVTRVEDVTGSPEMLDGRVKTLHPKIHGGLLADLGKESHRADLDLHGIRAVRARRVEPLPVPRAAPRHRDDRHRRPAMTRAAAKNHAWVTIVTESRPVRPAARRAARATTAPSAPRPARAFALEAFARTAAYDAAIVQWLQDDELLPAHLVLALDRTDETLRYGENPHQHGARYRRARHDELVGRRRSSTAGSRSRTSTTTTPTRRGSSCTISATGPRARSSSTRTRAASRVDDDARRSRTSARSSATSAPRSAASSR